jgi:hypothetical protein
MLSRRRLLGLSLAAWVVAAHALDKDPGGTDSLDPALGHVFSGAAAQRLARTLISPEDLGGTWNPDSAQIGQLEGALAKELGRRLGAQRDDGDPPPKVRDYYRQYAGIILNGRKLILINGFYKSHVEYTVAWLAQPRSAAELAAFPAEARNKDYWHFVPVVVLDGGEHYFDAYYDPAQRRISRFEFHGYG